MEVIFGNSSMQFCSVGLVALNAQSPFSVSFLEMTKREIDQASEKPVRVCTDAYLTFFLIDKLKTCRVLSISCLE
jgi:hypothetical protein